MLASTLDCYQGTAISDTPCTSVWINTDEFATLAGLTERGARKALIKCLSGGTWRALSLNVRVVEGTGGRGGKSYQVYVPSIPKDLRDIWHKRHPAALNHPTVEPIMLPAPESYDSRIAKEVAEWKWKLAIIAPALGFSKRSNGRGAVLADIAGKMHTQPDGKIVTYSVGTLRDWIRTAEEGDHTELARKHIKKGLRRVIINRKWDKSAPMPEPEKRRIAEEIEIHTRSLWRSGVDGWCKVDTLASSKLWELSRSAGWADASLEACHLGKYYVERHRGVGVVATKEKDAKRFADEFTPRIIRNRDGYKPMDVVIGDVHPLDVVKLHDGREVHARLIAWLDLATNDIHVTVVLLPKGRGIRQEDVARSFVAMVKDWGLPRTLYLDNGSEYKWDEMMAGFNAITGLVGAFHALLNNPESETIRAMVEESIRQKPITRAKPYNAPAKQIEAVFGILERGFFSSIQGWVGGDRMKKRTHKLGAQPRPFDGSEEEFKANINEALNFYRNTPQNGDTSPNDKRRAFYEQGWQPYTAEHAVFMFAFSEIIRVKVHTNGIEKDGAIYYSDAIVPFIGQTIDIRFAKWDRSHLFLISDNGEYAAIPKTKTYGQLEAAGAVEQGRRQGVQNAHMLTLKSGTKKLDLMAEMKRHNATQPPPPQLPEGIPLTLGKDSQAIAKALQAAPQAHLEPELYGGDTRNPTTREILKPTLSEQESPTHELQPFNLVAAITAHHQANEKEIKK